MKLLYHDESPVKRYKKVVKDCQEGYGIAHPERISGFGGFFFRLNDVYLYGRLETIAEQDPELKEKLIEFIKRFAKEDYGFVTRDEYDSNEENRWLCGSCCWTIGRYSFEEDKYMYIGGIVLEFLRDFGFMYCIEEDMSEIYLKYACPDHKTDLVYRP